METTYTFDPIGFANSLFGGIGGGAGTVNAGYGYGGSYGGGLGYGSTYQAPPMNYDPSASLLGGGSGSMIILLVIGIVLFMVLR
jgi:hypothetical protein